MSFDTTRLRYLAISDSGFIFDPVSGRTARTVRACVYRAFPATFSPFRNLI
jgi:hypothetical protein